MTALDVKPSTRSIGSSTRPQTFRLPLLQRSRKVKVNALLVLVTMIWGSTFLVVQRTIMLTGPFTFLTMRFGIGAIVLAGIFHKRLSRITSAEIIMGSIIGVFLFATYALQTTGLQYISSSKAGFITGLYVPLVAILAVPILRQKPTPGSVLGIALSLTGVILISVNKSFQFTFSLGELLVLGCAFASALHVILISKFTPRVDAVNLATVSDYLYLGGIARGPDGNLWFTYDNLTTNASGIGRMTTAGAITLTPTPTASSLPTDITAGPDGAMWFTEGSGSVGRITTG